MKKWKISFNHGNGTRTMEVEASSFTIHEGWVSFFDKTSYIFLAMKADGIDSIERITE